MHCWGCSCKTKLDNASPWLGLLEPILQCTRVWLPVSFCFFWSFILLAPVGLLLLRVNGFSIVNPNFRGLISQLIQNASTVIWFFFVHFSYLPHQKGLAFSYWIANFKKWILVWTTVLWEKHTFCSGDKCVGNIYLIIYIGFLKIKLFVNNHLCMALILPSTEEKDESVHLTQTFSAIFGLKLSMLFMSIMGFTLVTCFQDFSWCLGICIQIPRSFKTWKAKIQYGERNVVMTCQLAQPNSQLPGERNSQTQIFLLIRGENIIKYLKNWKHMQLQ